MGGRMGKLDAYLGSGSARTESFTVIKKIENEIEFIKTSNNGSSAAPIYSNKPNRIYVLINNSDQITSITKYENHKEVYSIHLGNHGNQHGWHVHEPRSFNNVRHIIPKTKEHENLYNKVIKKFKQDSR